MKLIVELTRDNFLDTDESYTLLVDGKEEFSIRNLAENPEDAYLFRDLGFVYYIPTLMRKAWEAGKNGEEFTCTRIKKKE